MNIICPICKSIAVKHGMCKKKQDHNYIKFQNYESVHFTSHIIDVFSNHIKIEYNGEVNRYKISNFKLYSKFKDYEVMISFINKMRMFS